MKEQMSKLMRMMQQLVVGGGQNSSGHSQGGPQIENESQPLPGQDQGHNIPPQGNDQEIDPFKDKNPESKYGQVKSCKVEFNQPSCWLYSVPNLLVFQQLETLYLGGNHVRVVCERV